MVKEIKTFKTHEFMDRFIEADPGIKKIEPDRGKFFIVPVEDMLRLSKLPVPPTRATTHTVIFLTSGIATMKIGPNQVKIYQNECLVVPAGQVFSYNQYEVNTGFISNFDNDFLVGKIGSRDLVKGFEFLNIWGNPVIRPDAQTAVYLRHSFQRVYDEYRQHGLNNAPIIQSHFIAALCDLNAIYRPLSNSKSKTAITLTNRFKELLHQHIRRYHQVSDYASMLNVSSNHLNKIIKEITRKPTSRWIAETLVTEAKILLFQTNNSIREIASELGIEDQSYFSRLFKKHEGMTPLAYRNRIEKS